MKILAFVVVGSLLLAGCATAPSPAPADQPLVSIKPADREEQELITATNNAEAIAQHAIVLSKKAGLARDEETAKQLRLRAVSFAKFAIARGSKNLLMPLIISEVQPDGSPIKRTFSPRADVDALVADGETHFRRREYADALKSYTRALEIDPGCWVAALYSGDVYFSEEKYEEAIPWFDRAIAIDPTKETAHRYRADALMHLGRIDDAGDGYIRAFVCMPQGPIPQKMFGDWIARRQLRLNRPDSSFISARIRKDQGKYALDLHPDELNWINLVYAFGAEIPDFEGGSMTEPGSTALAKEAKALRDVIRTALEKARTSPDDEELKAHLPAFELLAHIERDGLLEAHIFLDRPTKELLQEYPDYLSANQDKLVRYVKKYWLGLPRSGNQT